MFWFHGCKFQLCQMRSLLDYWEETVTGYSLGASPFTRGWKGWHPDYTLLAPRLVGVHLPSVSI